MQLHHLLVGRIRQRLASVSDIAEEQTRQSIEVTLALIVEDVAALPPYDDGELRLSAQIREVDPEMSSCELFELLRCWLRSHRRPRPILLAHPTSN